MQDVPVVKADSGVCVVSSKQVADSFGKVHRDVMRAIKMLDCSDDFRARNFAQSSYTSMQNKELDCYNMTRDGFAFLAMGFTGKEAAKWKEAYIAAFNAMEAEIRRRDESTMALLNRAVALMEDDKEKASAFGKGLATWKTQKREHAENISALVDKAQMVLGLDGE
jgi:Rha family phage regulatory protein